MAHWQISITRQPPKTKAELRQMLAVIGDSGNAGSVGLHTTLGFEHVGVFKDAGFKFGRWVDVVLMQLTL